MTGDSEGGGLVSAPPWLRKFGAILGIIAATLILYAVWARPYQLHWGASAEEVERAMPGDELDPQAAFLATRAIGIAGTADEIWPWLIQMGYTRAGFYGFDLFERVGTVRGPYGVDRILPQFQDFRVGDEMPITPFETMVFDRIEPNRHMVLRTPDSGASYTWALYPGSGDMTRLVVRTRWKPHWSRPDGLALDLLTEFSDHIAMRKVLEGIKGRVEGSVRPRSDLNIELTIYFGVLAVFVWGLIGIGRLPLTRQRWLVGLAGGLALLVTWYGPVSIWVGATLSLLVVWAIRLEYREHKRRRLLEQYVSADKH